MIVEVDLERFASGLLDFILMTDRGRLLSLFSEKRKVELTRMTSPLPIFKVTFTTG